MGEQTINKVELIYEPKYEPKIDFIGSLGEVCNTYSKKYSDFVVMYELVTYSFNILVQAYGVENAIIIIKDLANGIKSAMEKHEKDKNSSAERVDQNQ